MICLQQSRPKHWLGSSMLFGLGRQQEDGTWVISFVFKFVLTFSKSMSLLHWIWRTFIGNWTSCCLKPCPPLIAMCSSGPPRILKLSWVLLSCRYCKDTWWQDVHVVLRGRTKGLNFASEHVCKAAEIIEKKKAKFEEEKFDCSRKFLFVFFWSDPVPRWQLAKKPQQPIARHLQDLRATCGWREEYYWCHDWV